jgi:DNA-binding NtrC family response regulator
MGRPVWVIDGEHWPRACLRAELIERGLDAIGFESTAEALVALWLPAQIAPVVVVIDLRSQRLDARTLAAFRARGCRLVAIAGAVEREAAVAHSAAWSALLPRPVALGTIADLVQRLMNEGAAAPVP